MHEKKEKYYQIPERYDIILLIVLRVLNKDGEKGGVMGNYQLRKAAGLYWLLDLEQSGFDYKKPLPLNESGAKIWRLIQAGMPEEEMAAAFAADYGIGMEQAREDIGLFLQQLRKQGIKC